MHNRPTRVVAVFSLCAAALALVACNASRTGAVEPATPATGTADSSFATDDVAYLTRLGLIRGHLRVGMELYAEGRHEHAKRHMKHPADELYAELTDAFEHRGSPGFAPELETLAELVQQDADDAEIRNAYTVLLARIAAAESRVDSTTAVDAQAHGAIAVNLLDEAAREYRIGVVDGNIEEVHEYQDAWGFARIAIDYTRQANVVHADSRLLDDNLRELERLGRLWPDLAPPGPVGGDGRDIAELADKLATDLQEID